MSPAPQPHAAHLILTSILEPSRDHRTVTLYLPSGKQHTCKLRAFRRSHLTPDLTGTPVDAHLWPRTDHHARLTHRTQLFRFAPTTSLENTFTITGRLILRKEREQRAVILIRRNHEGNLAREFPIEVALTPETLQLTPQPLPPELRKLEGIQYKGVLKNGLLLATTATIVRLEQPKPTKKRPPTEARSWAS